MNRIRIDFIKIWNFRNYERLECPFNFHFNVFTGLNGAGKTSLLDAIFYATNGKSYFSHRDQYIYREGTDFFRIEAQLDAELTTPLEITSSAVKGKAIKLDEKRLSRLVDFVGRYPSFMIAPRDISILLESSVERRRLINKTLSQVDPTYFKMLLDYNRLLKQRNALLKSMNEGMKVDPILMESINQKMKPPSDYIFEKRNQYTQDIKPLVNTFYKELSNASEILEIEYASELHESDLTALFEANKRKDMFAAKTTSGIHKDDIRFLMNNKELKKFASQGQLKSAIIALKLAQLEFVRQQTQKIPILLLDDIFDKLDQQRVESFLKICLETLNAQVFITDTDKERIISQLEKLKVDYTSYEIANGQIVST